MSVVLLLTNKKKKKVEEKVDEESDDDCVVVECRQADVLPHARADCPIEKACLFLLYVLKIKNIKIVVEDASGFLGKSNSSCHFIDFFISSLACFSVTT